MNLEHTGRRNNNPTSLIICQRFDNPYTPVKERPSLAHIIVNGKFSDNIELSTFPAKSKSLCQMKFPINPQYVTTDNLDIKNVCINCYDKFMALMYAVDSVHYVNNNKISQFNQRHFHRIKNFKKAV